MEPRGWIDDERRPEIGGPAKHLERRRQNADDRVRRAIEREAPPHDGRIAAESLRPERVRDDRDGFLSWMKANVLDKGPEVFKAQRERLAAGARS